MKKIIFIACILVSMKGICQIPNYFPNGAVWNEIYTEESGGNMSTLCSTVSNYNLKVEADVVLGGKTYKKIHKNGILQSQYSHFQPQINYTPSCNFTANISENKFVRQDGKKVFVYLTDSTELLLYDFNLKLADTFYFKGLKTLYMDSVKCKVKAVDSLLIENEYRKVFTLSHSDYSFGSQDTISTFIEGVGNLGGLFSSIPRFTEFSTQTLNCFGVNNKTYYSAKDAICDYNVSVSKISPTFLISYYPNPVQQQLFLELKSETQVKDILFFDLVGQRLNLSFEKLEDNNYKIDVSNLNNGIYFLRIYDENSNSTEIKICKE